MVSSRAGIGALAACLAVSGQAHSSLNGLEVQLDPFALDGVTPLGALPGYAGQLVYNVYASFNHPADHVLGVVGNPDSPFQVQTVKGTGFFNVEPGQGGGDTPPSQAIVMFNPALNWDSFFTIGAKFSQQFTVALIIAPFTPGPNTDPWPPVPGANMGWFTTLPNGQPPPEAIAGPTGLVLLMRLTVEPGNSLTGSFGLDWRDGQTSEAFVSVVSIAPLPCAPVGGDCNRNGQADECDIAFGASQDCNFNLVPDECESDCNGNGMADECEDCNGNGMADECDLDEGSSLDCDANGVPDECQNDCNGNGIADVCDLDEGTSSDCNGNAIPDECEDSVPFSASSGPMGPIGAGVPQSALIDAPLAMGEVTLLFIAQADLGGPAEWLVVAINGVHLATLFQASGHNCPSEPDAETLVLTAEAFNGLIAGPQALIAFTASDDVDPMCDEFATSLVSVQITYAADADVNDNDVPDECECPADVARPRDGVVDVADLVAVVLSWGQPGGPADVNQDGLVDILDLILVVLEWGACG